MIKAMLSEGELEKRQWLNFLRDVLAVDLFKELLAEDAAGLDDLFPVSNAFAVAVAETEEIVPVGDLAVRQTLDKGPCGAESTTFSML